MIGLPPTFDPRPILNKIKDLAKRLSDLETRTRLLYAKGTYTPTYLGASTAGITTYTTQAGFYTRIGRIVFFNGRVVWTAATGTGTAIISLPFTSANTSEMHYALAVRTNGVTFANGNLVARISPNAAVFQMDSLLTNAAPTAVSVEAAGDVLWGGFFFTG